MKPAVAYPDAEVAIVHLLDALLAGTLDTPEEQIGTELPANFSGESSPAFVQVSWDGTPQVEHPVVAHATVRIVAWAADSITAKALAARVQGLLLTHTGGGGVSRIQSLTGIIPARDPDNRADLASFTVRVTLRSTPISRPEITFPYGGTYGDD